MQVRVSYNELRMMPVLKYNATYPTEYLAVRALDATSVKLLTLGRDADRQRVAPVTINTNRRGAALQPVTFHTAKTGF